MHRIAAVTPLAIVAFSFPALAEETLVETNFDPADMTEVTLILEGGQTAQQIRDGGNSGDDPDPFREVTTVSNATVSLAHLSSNMVYDPAEGAILGVRFRVDRKAFAAFGQGMAYAMTAEQNGIVYDTPSFITGSGSDAFEWMTTTGDFVGVPAFNPIVGGSDPIDFSAGAPPITFGLRTSNSGGAGIVVGYDNLTVTVRNCELTGDGVVDAADLASLLASWGPCGDCPADFSFDGVVDSADLATLLACWG